MASAPAGRAPARAAPAAVELEDEDDNELVQRLARLKG